MLYCGHWASSSPAIPVSKRDFGLKVADHPFQHLSFFGRLGLCIASRDEVGVRLRERAQICQSTYHIQFNTKSN